MSALLLKSVFEDEVLQAAERLLLSGQREGEIEGMLAGELAHYEIPLFAVLEGAPFPIFIFMTAVLCVAIYTTTISSILGLSSRFLSFVNWPRWVIVILLLSIMAPFTSIGFSNLIAFLYPIYGLLNLYLLVNILLYPILSKWK